MSEWKAEVFKLGKFGKHPNADNLSIYQFQNYPVIFRTGDFKEGDLVAYVPIDSIVPDIPEWSFLDGHRRIRAKKLRGIFSIGMIVKAPEGTEEGQLVNDKLGLEKYEPPISANTGGDNERDPGFMPKYDVEGLRKYPNILGEGEMVIITEKIHGTNARYCWHEDRLWVGSHNTIKKYDLKNLYWKIAEQYSLAKILVNFPNKIFYGEIYGWVQNLRYGHKPNEQSMAWFDVFDLETGKFLNEKDFQAICADVYYSAFDKIERSIKMVPTLYYGEWKKELKSFADGPSTLADNIREGFVVKPLEERWDQTIGRVILKLHGEQYLLSKYA